MLMNSRIDLHDQITKSTFHGLVWKGRNLIGYVNFSRMFLQRIILLMILPYEKNSERLSFPLAYD